MYIRARDSDSLHIGEALECLGEVRQFLGVAGFDRILDAVVDVTLEDQLAYLVQGGFRSTDLCEDILTRGVIIDHALDGLQLSDDPLHPGMELFGIHTMTHVVILR